MAESTLMTQDESAVSSSSKERLQWLRDHGVTVETPTDRVELARAQAAALSLKEGDPDTRTVRYVRIPAGMIDPLEELTAVIRDENSIEHPPDALMPILGAKFSSGTVDREALKQASIHNMNEGGAKLGLGALTPESIAAIGGQAEPFRLSDTVTMYLDAVGALKRLPINPRAADLAERAGYGGGVAFHGDVFIGRKDLQSSKNIDFRLSEAHVSADWIRSAFRENLAHQQKDSRIGQSADELSHRGGDGDGYTWSQDPSDVEICVPVPEKTKAKDVVVKFKPSSISINVVGGVDLDLQLYARISADGSSWSLSDGAVVITLEKGEEGETWPTLSRS